MAANSVPTAANPIVPASATRSSRGTAGPDVQVVEDPRRRDEDHLHRQHQRRGARELAEVDRALVGRRQDEPVQAVVLALEREGAAEPEHPGQDEARARSRPGQRGADAVAVGPEGEVEEEQEHEREERERVGALLRPPLDGQVLPEDGPRRAQERAHAPASASRARVRGAEIEPLERLLGEARARRLGRDAAPGEDGHAVGDRQGAPEAVGDHHRGAAGGLEGVEVILEALGAVLVEPRERPRRAAAPGARGASRAPAPTRRRSPLESARTRAPAWPSRPTRASAASIRPASARRPARASQKARFSRGVRSS